MSSRSSLRHGLPHIRVPTIIICYTADRGVYPDDVAEMLAISAAEDKLLHHVDGEHFGQPIDGAGERDPRGRVAKILSGWLGQRFPAAEGAAMARLPYARIDRPESKTSSARSPPSAARCCTSTRCCSTARRSPKAGCGS